MTVNKKRRLGKGLEALLSPTPSNTTAPSEPASQPTRPTTSAQEPRILPMRTATPDSAVVPTASETPAPSDSSPENDTKGLVYLDVDRIVENPFQPRREFSEAELASLSESLKEHDMLQPILVRTVEGRYQIISGERRWRAAQLAGWTKIPARIREADDRLVAELAIVENLQRKDLNPLEKAMSFRRYLDEHDCSQEDLAGRLKIDRSTISNLMRLLDLPTVVQDALRGGVVSAGHARALLPLGNSSLQVEFCNTIQREGWSVRETERQVHQKIVAEDGTTDTEAGTSKKTSRGRNVSPQIQALEQQLKRALGTTVEIKASARGKGKITIQFANNDEFIRIRELLVENTGPDNLRRVG